MSRTSIESRTTAARRLLIADVIFAALIFGALSRCFARFQSQISKTFANYRVAVPGIKTFFKFAAKIFGRACRVRNAGEACGSRRVTCGWRMADRARNLPSKRVAGA